jgi:hypothetical protein
MLSNLALSNPVSTVTQPDLISRGEVNPVSPKFSTIPDADMPGVPNFFVTSKDNLSHWDPNQLIMATSKIMPGISLAGFPIANGYLPPSTSCQLHVYCH